MKNKLTFAFVMLSLMLVSCSKESDTDGRDQFEGSYRVALTATTTGNAVLTSDTVTLMVRKSGAENLIAQTSFSVSSFTIDMELTIDSVFWHRGAGRSALFKVAEQPVQIGGANVGNVKGIALGTNSYHGNLSYVATSVFDADGNANTVNVQNVKFSVSGVVSPMAGMNIPMTIAIGGMINR